MDEGQPPSVRHECALVHSAQQGRQILDQVGDPVGGQSDVQTDQPASALAGQIGNQPDRADGQMTATNRPVLLLEQAQLAVTKGLPPPTLLPVHIGCQRSRS